MTRIISSIPVVGSIWDRFSQTSLIRFAIDECKLTLRYRTIRPSRISLPRAKSSLFVDRLEPRGRRVLLGGGDGQRRLKEIWRMAAQRLHPQVVLDVGLNYGEFLFSEHYPAAESLIGIEANQALERWLRKSADSHPQASIIRLEIALAAGESNQVESFYVDASSSGRSSVVCRDPKTCQAQDVRTVAVDDLLADSAPDASTILFKIDVEGFEPQVFAGMSKLTSRFEKAIGITEFNDQLVAAAGFDPNAFLHDLNESFEVWAVPHEGKPFGLQPCSLPTIQESLGSDHVELDLVLFSEAIREEAIEILTSVTLPD